jgi:phosphoglycerate dehydrogenase-like enzyme
MELAGKTIGVIGLGLIGCAVGRIAAGLGMRVLGWSFREDAVRAKEAGATLVSLDDLFAQSDVVSVHLRNSAQARGLIGSREIGRMKRGALFVNTARGAIVDERALLEALRSGHLGGAGLDVFVQEPLPPDSPWLALDNVVLSPHAGAVTAEASERLAEWPIDNLFAWAAGTPKNVVNPGAVEHEKQRERNHD